MIMTPAVRKIALTTHVAFSVGWLGAVATFLALGIAGLVSQDAETVRGAYLAMNVIGLSVIIPLSFGSLLTGLIEALGSAWGLFRCYWVIAKLLLTVLATALLLLHQYSAVAVAAKRVLSVETGALPRSGPLGMQLVVDASLAILALLTSTALAVYKPRGLTSYGWRKAQERGKLPYRTAAISDSPSRGLKILISILGAIVIVFIIVHFAGLTGAHWAPPKAEW